MAIHALISCKLDYCNSLHDGLSKSQINKYQYIMNSAAHMIDGQVNSIMLPHKKFCHKSRGLESKLGTVSMTIVWIWR